jgi:hypothetical protein
MESQTTAVQQLKAEIVALVNEIDADIGNGRVTQRSYLREKLRQLLLR